MNSPWTVADSCRQLQTNRGQLQTQCATVRSLSVNPPLVGIMYSSAVLT